MVLVVNNDIIQLKFRTTTLETRLNYTSDNIGGTFRVTDCKRVNPDGSLSKIILKDDDVVELRLFDKVFKLDTHIHVYHGDWLYIISQADNIYDVHNIILNTIAPQMIQSLKCFNIYPGCNLKCPYCSQGVDSHFHYDDDFLINKQFISKNIEMTNNAFENQNVRWYMDRVMGDETLLNWDMFINRVNDMINCGLYHKNGSFELYTNATIPENVKKLLKWIKSDGFNYYSRFEILVTVDTLDFRTSLRYNTEELFNKFMESLNILKSYTSYPHIDIFFNVMYSDDHTFIDVVKRLSEMGFKYYKPGFNEKDDSYDYVDNYTLNAANLYKECSKYMELVKTRNKTDLVYAFQIHEFDKLVYEHKYTFDVGYSAVQYFQSHITRENEAGNETWNRITVNQN